MPRFARGCLVYMLWGLVCFLLLLVVSFLGGISAPKEFLLPSASLLLVCLFLRVECGSETEEMSSMRNPHRSDPCLLYCIAPLGCKRPLGGIFAFSVAIVTPVYTYIFSPFFSVGNLVLRSMTRLLYPSPLTLTLSERWFCILT